jgi:hypothetical protein
VSRAHAACLSCWRASAKNLDRKTPTTQKVARPTPNSNDERSKLWSLAANKATIKMTKARQKRVALILQPNVEVWLRGDLRRSRSTRSMLAPRLGVTAVSGQIVSAHRYCVKHPLGGVGGGGHRRTSCCSEAKISALMGYGGTTRGAVSLPPQASEGASQLRRTHPGQSSSGLALFSYQESSIDRRRNRFTLIQALAQFRERWSLRDFF